MCYALLSACILFSAHYITPRKNKKLNTSGVLLHRNRCCARFLPITKLPNFPLFLEGSEPHIDCDWELKTSTGECTVATLGADLDISFGRWSFPWESHCGCFWKWQYSHSSADWQLNYLELELSWVEGEGEWQRFACWKLFFMANCNRRGGLVADVEGAVVPRQQHPLN